MFPLDMQIKHACIGLPPFTRMRQNRGDPRKHSHFERGEPVLLRINKACMGSVDVG